jgi:hypothetical protein
VPNIEAERSWPKQIETLGPVSFTSTKLWESKHRKHRNLGRLCNQKFPEKDTHLMAIKEIGHQLSSKNREEITKVEHFPDMSAVGPPKKAKWHYRKREVISTQRSYY